MAILLLRHTSAGHRRTWDGPDHLRPLDEQGRRRGRGARGHLRAVRGRAGADQPLRPLPEVGRAARPAISASPSRSGPSSPRARPRAETLGLVGDLAGQSAVLCTHGDIVAELLGEESLKGSTWVVEPGPDGSLRRLEYLPPPT